MNTKYLLLGLGIVLTACSSENDEFNVTNASKAQLTISTEIVTTRANFDTGLANDVEFRQGNTIGIWLFDKNGYDYSRYTDETTAWNRKAMYPYWSMDETITLTDIPAKVVAYYPYQETSSSNSETRVVPPVIRLNHPIADINIASYAHGDGQQDYLWGESIDSVDSHYPIARIQFKHVLPRITFEVQKSSDNATDEIYLRRAILKNKADNGNTICTTGTLYENGSIDKSDATGQSITNSYTAPVLLNKGEARTFDFLVLPTEVTDGSVILKIEAQKGSTGNFQYYDIPIPATNWESGKQYTYPVTLNITESQQEIPGEKIYMGFNDDNGQPLYWSSWNLGASKIEDYGDYYAWGELQPKTKFDWSTYSLCNGTAESCSDIGQNISGTRYDAVRKKWGAKWRIPTKSEFQKLLDNCTISWKYINGVKGISVKAKNGNTIFLPAAGCYLSNNNEGKPGLINYGFYNTATLSFSYYVSHFVFGETWHNGNPYFSAGYRCEGLPIRPVTE